MNYFAYASNLSRKQMAEHCPDAKPKIVATLPNYKILFTGYSRIRKGAVATIIGSKGDKVLGAVYEITEACLRKLDRHEGCPDIYKHLKVIVFTDADEAIEAITFIKTRQEEEDNPSPEYRSVIQQGYRDWGMI
ncbi:MAG: gamma-glutamylcyclotransferase [Dehalococcoidia bacterium]|nr:gamma-glutamylcyclotransferase [Dehalococcoidia bacterium]